MSNCNHEQLCVAFTDSYEELKRFIQRKFGCPQLAEEVVQETWLKLQSIKTPSMKSPRCYLFRIAANLAIDTLRAEKSRNQHVVMEDDIAAHNICGAPAPERVIASHQSLSLLMQAVDELPPRCREVFLLHKFEYLTHSEISDRLCISRNMVEKHVIRALAHCRRCLERQDNSLFSL